MALLSIRERSSALGRNRGFTIIELMITITILAILAGAGIPQFSRMIRDQRVKNAALDFYASLALARSESIKQGTDVALNPNSAANWAAGWQIVDASGATVKIQNAIPGVAATGPTSLTYRRDGRVSDTTVQTFVLSSPTDATITARCVRVDPSGRPAIKVDTNNNIADGCQ
jgi:type IV fimbrial biogenesis protein FimT